jgi:hypothetical protein
MTIIKSLDTTCLHFVLIVIVMFVMNRCAGSSACVLAIGVHASANDHTYEVAPADDTTPTLELEVLPMTTIGVIYVWKTV